MKDAFFITRRILLAGVSAIVLGMLGGCEESVDAVLDADQAYTIYGFLNPRSDVQALRIFPIAPLLTPDLTEPLDGEVTSTNLVTGETVAWRDSIVAYPNGSVGYVAFAPFRAEYGHAYRLTVRRSDGVQSEVVVPVPPLATVDRAEPFTRRFPNRILDSPFLPYEVDGDIRLMQIEASYTFEVLNVGTTTRSVRYDGEEIRTPTGWRVEVDMGRDQESIREELLRTGFMQNPQAQLELRWLTFSTMIVNTGWDPPGGTFDPNLLAEPGAWTNVENGFGFVGGGYVDDFVVTPTGCYAFLAGFFVPEGNPCAAG